MLFELARWLQQFESLFGLFNYLTFRSILAALTALFLSLWIGPVLIQKLSRFKGGSRSVRMARRCIFLKLARRRWAVR